MRTLRVQFLGLVWRGGKIDHPNGEHDDYANGAAGALNLASKNQVFNPRASPDRRRQCNPIRWRPWQYARDLAG